MRKLVLDRAPKQKAISFLRSAGAALAVSIAGSGCAHQIEPLADTRFPGNLQREAEVRCSERRGDSKFVPQREFRTDGCTLWPDSVWQSCCVEHDMTYWCGGIASERKTSDWALRDCVADKGHPAIGTIMALAIRFTGTGFLPAPWRWGYGWPWLGKMERQSTSDSIRQESIPE